MPSSAFAIASRRGVTRASVDALASLRSTTGERPLRIETAGISCPPRINEKGITNPTPWEWHPGNRSRAFRPLVSLANLGPIEQQPRNEAALVSRHLVNGTLVLYDVSSSYMEGRCCPLAKYGYSRDHRS